MKNIATRASTLTARRQLTFALPVHDSKHMRNMEAEDAAKHLQQAACLAVRAGRDDVANAALAALEQLEAGK